MSIKGNFPRQEKESAASPYEDGLMSKQDKIKLDSVETNANNYIHPDNENIRHVTDLEKQTWNNKESQEASALKAQNAVAQSKAYVDNIYQTMLNTISNSTLGSTDVATDPAFLALVAKVEAKPSSNIASSAVNGLMAKEDKFKLDNIEPNANNYTHPTSHPASMIEQDNLHRMVTDAQISIWDAKASIALATTETDGLISKELIKKLNSIASEANNYVHPASHSAIMIKEDGEHRFVTDLEKVSWNAKADSTIATLTSKGLMSANDRAKLNNIMESTAKITMTKSNKDANGIYTITSYNRADGTLYKRVILSGGESPRYANRTEEFYNTGGNTLLISNVYTLTYDEDGTLISES
jgi:hypothetical protein